MGAEDGARNGWQAATIAAEARHSEEVSRLTEHIKTIRKEQEHILHKALRDRKAWEAIGDEYSKLIDHCTRGLLSKANLPAKTVIGVMEERLFEPLQSRIDNLRTALEEVRGKARPFTDGGWHDANVWCADKALAHDDKLRDGK